MLIVRRRPSTLSWPRHVLGGLAVATAAAVATKVWTEVHPTAPSFMAQDLFHLFYPAHAYVGVEFAAGRLPLWNPYVGLGASEVADPQLGVWYPPNLLFLVAPTDMALDLLALFHVILGAAGAYLLCRDAGIGAAGGAVAAVVLATGGPLQHGSAWPPVLGTFAWCPFAILLGRRLAAAPRLHTALVLGVVFAMQMLAGYFQLHLYTACVVALFAFFAAPRGRSAWVRAGAWLAAAEAIGLALAAVQVLPAMAAVRASFRSPDFMEPSYLEIFPVRLEHYRSSLAVSALDARAAVYSGVLAPLLVLAGVLRTRRPIPLRVPVAVLLGAALVLSLGSATPVFSLLWRSPVAHWLTGPYKWTYVVGLGLALGAAIGADILLGPKGPDRRGRLLWVVLGGSFLLLVPYSVGARAVGVLGLIAGLASGRVVAAALPVAVGLAVLAGIHERPLRPKDDPDFFARYDEAYAAVRSRGDPGRVFAMLPTLVFPLRHGELKRRATFNTYETLLPVRTFRLRQAIERALPLPAERARALFGLRAVGIRYVLSGHDRAGWLEAQGLLRVFTSPAADVWEDPAALPRVYLARESRVVPASDALERVFDRALSAQSAVLLETEDSPAPPVSESGTATLVRDHSTHVRVAVETPGPGVLVLLDAWSPDWRATIDGVPATIRHANYLGRAVEVPPGRHEVDFRFVPRAFHLGATITILALLTVLAILWLGAARRSDATDG